MNSFFPMDTEQNRDIMTFCAPSFGQSEIGTYLCDCRTIG